MRPAQFGRRPNCAGPILGAIAVGKFNAAQNWNSGMLMFEENLNYKKEFLFIRIGIVRVCLGINLFRCLDIFIKGIILAMPTCPGIQAHLSTTFLPLTGHPN